jgi:molecular chaperone GrpE
MKEHDDTAQASGPDAPAPSDGNGAPTPGEAGSGGAEAIPQPDPRDIEIAELRRRLSETEARLKTVSKGYTDLESDMDSFRRRMTAQADQRVERKSAEVVEKFFEPVQNLKRSLEAGKADPAGVLAGLQMVLQQFTEVLNRLGLEEVPGVGASFDPNIHEALAVAPVTDKAQDGKVVTVYASGWRLGSKVLQPAQVVIGKYTEAAEA